MGPNTNNSFRQYCLLNKAYREDYLKNTEPEQDFLLNKQYNPKPDLVENYSHKW